MLIFMFPGSKIKSGQRASPTRRGAPQYFFFLGYRRLVNFSKYETGGVGNFIGIDNGVMALKAERIRFFLSMCGWGARRVITTASSWQTRRYGVRGCCFAALCLRGGPDQSWPNPREMRRPLGLAQNRILR